MTKRQREQQVKEVCRRLVAVRIAMGLSQTAMAEMMEITLATWNNYERLAKRIEVDNALKLARKTGVSLDWVYLGNPRGLPPVLRRSIIKAMTEPARKAA